MLDKIFSAFEKAHNAGIIKEYALGGAMSMLYYLSPVETEDYDVFVFVTSTSHLDPLGDLYSFFRSMGYNKFRGEHLIIENSPVQILLAPNSLVEEAIKNAVDIFEHGIRIPIFPLEYLMTICVQVGRAKDQIRLQMVFDEEIPFDNGIFEELLFRFNLVEKWTKIKNRFT